MNETSFRVQHLSMKTAPSPEWKSQIQRDVDRSVSCLAVAIFCIQATILSQIHTNSNKLWIIYCIFPFLRSCKKLTVTTTIVNKWAFTNIPWNCCSSLSLNSDDSERKIYLGVVLCKFASKSSDAFGLKGWFWTTSRQWESELGDLAIDLFEISK